MKTLNNSNLTLNQVLQAIVSQSVNDILIQEGIKSGDENPIKGLNDVKKKGTAGVIIPGGAQQEGAIAVKLDSGEVIIVEVDSGWYALYFGKDEDQRVNIDYDYAGNPYIISTVGRPDQVINYSNKYYVIQVSDDTNTNKIQVYPNKIELGMADGKTSGLVEITKLTEKINQLVDAINQLATAFKAHTHNVTAVGAPSGPVTPPYVGTFNKFNKDDYENPDIQQFYK